MMRAPRRGGAGGRGGTMGGGGRGRGASRGRGSFQEYSDFQQDARRQSSDFGNAGRNRGDDDDDDEYYDVPDGYGNEEGDEDNLLFEDQQQKGVTSAAASSSANSNSNNNNMTSNILNLGQGGTAVIVTGTSSLRWAVAASVITNKPVTFRGITTLPAEAVSFLRLISQITTGSQFTLSADGSELKFVPGLITAQGSIVHEFNLTGKDSNVPQGWAAITGGNNAAGPATLEQDASRSIGYFVEPLLLLLPFSRRAVSLTLVGASHCANDLCLHTVRTVTLRVAQAFGIQATLRIVRHSGSKAAGCAILSVTPARQLRCAKLTDFGLVARVRGIAFGADLSPDLVQRAAVATKGALLNFLPDVYVVTDIGSTSGGRRGGGGDDSNAPVVTRASSAFGIMLVADTSTKKAVVSQETTAAHREDPDAVGIRAAKLLLDEIASGGCIDRHHQPLALMLMALAPDDVSTIRFGQLTSAALSALHLMDRFMGVRPVIKDHVATDGGVMGGCTVSCFGSATINLTKRSG